MPRLQFSIRTLLWLTLVVAAFLGGMLYGEKRAEHLFDTIDWPDSPYHLEADQLEAIARHQSALHE